MKELSKISTEDEMQEWLEKLENANGILPDGDFRWWQCPHCYHQGRHTGYHFRTMLRTPVEADGTLAYVLRDLAIKKDMVIYDKNLLLLWKKQKNEFSDLLMWLIFYVEPWQMIKAACLTLKEINVCV